MDQGSVNCIPCAERLFHRFDHWRETDPRRNAPATRASAQGSLYLRALSHEDRRALGKSMRSYHTREMRQMDRAGYENALVLLRATPLIQRP